MMCISLFSYGKPVVVRCKGVRLGMGWVGSWVHKFTWQWLGWVGSVIWWVGLGWVDENRPMDNSTTIRRTTLRPCRLTCCGLLPLLQRPATVTLMTF